MTGLEAASALGFAAMFGQIGLYMVWALSTIDSVDSKPTVSARGAVYIVKPLQVMAISGTGAAARLVIACREFVYQADGKRAAA